MGHRPPHERTPASGEPPKTPRDPGYEDALDELPPNVPPGMLGERGLNLYKEETDGPHGLNAGLLQERSPEVVWLSVVLAYLLFFPLAYVILWRTRCFTTRGKWIGTAIMTAGIAVVAVLFATGVIYVA